MSENDLCITSVFGDLDSKLQPINSEGYIHFITSISLSSFHPL